MDYIKSAHLAGVGNLRIMFVHILPNAVTVLLSSVMIGFNNAVLAEAGMSYLGIGVQPPRQALAVCFLRHRAICSRLRIMRFSRDL